MSLFVVKKRIGKMEREGGEDPLVELTKDQMVITHTLTHTHKTVLYVYVHRKEKTYLTKGHFWSFGRCVQDFLDIVNVHTKEDQGRNNVYFIVYYVWDNVEGKK